jgi:hypothetical protein
MPSRDLPPPTVLPEDGAVRRVSHMASTSFHISVRFRRFFRAFERRGSFQLSRANLVLANRAGSEGACGRGSGGRLFARTRDRDQSSPTLSKMSRAIRFGCGSEVFAEPSRGSRGPGLTFCPRKPSGSGISAQVGGCRQAGNGKKMTPTVSLLGIREIGSSSPDRQSRSSVQEDSCRCNRRRIVARSCGAPGCALRCSCWQP